MRAASEFKRQLKDLMDRIEKTGTHYVRCVKPNKQHVPLSVCSGDILSQLICSGKITTLATSVYYACVM